MSPEAFDAAEVLNWRHRPVVPAGKCLYIQSGDPGDFDGRLGGCLSCTGLPPPLRTLRCSGYLIGVAGHVLEQHTKDMMYALVVSRRDLPPRVAPCARTSSGPAPVRRSLSGEHARIETRQMSTCMTRTSQITSCGCPGGCSAHCAPRHASSGGHIVSVMPSIVTRQHGDGHVAPCNDNMAMERCTTTPWPMGSQLVLETDTGYATTGAIFESAAL